MSLNLQQTDTDGPCNRVSYDAGVTWSTAGFDRVASEGGTPGTGLYSVTCVRDGLPNNEAWAAVLVCTIPDGYDWGAGDWTVRLKTTPFFGGVLKWVGIRIVRMSSGCLVQGVMGEDTSFAITCTAAVHTRTITGVAATTPQAGDHIGILLRFRNEHPTASQTIQVTPDQIIDCPFEEITEVIITPAAAVLRMRPRVPSVRAVTTPAPASLRLTPGEPTPRAVVRPAAAELPIVPGVPRIAAVITPVAAHVRLLPMGARFAAIVRPAAARLRLAPGVTRIAALLKNAAAKLRLLPRTPRITDEPKPQPRDLAEDRCLEGATAEDCNNWPLGDPTAPQCISCVPVGGTIVGRERPCQLAPSSGSQTQTALCAALSFPGARAAMRCPRGFALRPLPPLNDDDPQYWDVELSSLTFYAGPGPVGGICPPTTRPEKETTHKYYLQGQLWLLVDPCHPIPCANQFGGTWLCRAYINHEEGSAWRMWCNPLVHGAQGAPTPTDPDVLLQERTLVLSPDTLARQPMTVAFTADGDTQCFQLEDQYCFTDKCRDDPHIWTCIGSNNPNGSPAYEQLAILDRLHVTWHDGPNGEPFGYSTIDAAYPHANPADVTLKNQCLAMLRSYVEQLDHGGSGEPAHLRSQQYDSPRLNRWRHVEGFATHPPGEPDRVDYPHVTVDGTRNGTPVPIACVEPVTGAEFPATLRLDSVEINLHASVERIVSFPAQGSAYTAGRRAIGCVDVLLRVLVMLEPEAYQVAWPFQLLGRPVAQGGLGDRRNLEIEDPERPGQIIPWLRLVPKGPGGARVTVAIPWRGLRGAAPYAFEPAFGARGCFPPGGPAFVCCPALYCINRATWMGEFNDFTNGGLNPQRYTGWMTTHVTNLDRNSPEWNGGFGCEC